MANLIWKGKTLYNPTTGRALTTLEWDAFKRALEKWLNLHTRGVAGRIVLDNTALGAILDRMLVTNSLKAVREAALKAVTIGGHNIDYIGESTAHIEEALGHPLPREQKALIHATINTAGRRIRRVSGELLGDIKEVLVEGASNRWSCSKVSQELFNRCHSANRDFLRIADTEGQNALNIANINEAIYGAPEGTRVYFKRLEVVDQYTCKYCRSMAGAIAVYNDSPDYTAPYTIAPDSSAPHNTAPHMGDTTVSSGVFHPWCRGVWVEYKPGMGKSIGNKPYDPSLHPHDPNNGQFTYKLCPDIKGITRGKPMTHRRADGRRGNPYWWHKDARVKGYANNCSACVVAYELRRRGYMVSAAPKIPGNAVDILSGDTTAIWRDTTTHKPPLPLQYHYPTEDDRHAMKGLIKWLETNIVAGARYHLSFINKGEKCGHITTISRDRWGRLFIYDPQSGYNCHYNTRKFKKYMQDIILTDFRYPVKMYRVDNLAFDPSIAAKVLEGASK